MRVNLRALGLALLAAFAISAVAASGAQALEVKFTGDQAKVVGTGHEEGGEEKNYFEATPGTKLTCKSVTYEATLTEASKELTVTPHYTECEAHRAVFPKTVEATIDLNTCDYLFTTTALHAEEEKDATGKVHIKCPAGKSITITIGTCTVHIPEQTLGGAAGEVTFTNKPAEGITPKPWVTVDIDITNKIKYTDTDGLFCPFEGEHTTENGSFVSTVKFKGYEDLGTHVGETVDGNGTKDEKNTYTEGKEIGIHVKTK